MNKSNAHLYLPLVQALADGKTIQINHPQRGWEDCDALDFSWGPEYYRVKPLEWPPIPEGCSLHNPDNLTPEQVGDGWRLLTVEEMEDGRSSGEHFKGEQYWYCARWHSSCNGACRHRDQTNRLPISTPYPDGSRIVDGKLVKPWVPKFSVGQRVKVSALRHGNDEPIMFVKRLPDSEALPYTCEYSEGGFCEQYMESRLEPVPWTLTRHIPGFRPLRDGEEWHREDWAEEMLEGGWRPLLLHEPIKKDDEMLAGPRAYWTRCVSDSPLSAVPGYVHHRTRRPLSPLPEPKKRVPLSPSDVPPGSAIRDKEDASPWRMLTAADSTRVFFQNSVRPSMTYIEMMDEEKQILRHGQTEWQPCYKETP